MNISAKAFRVTSYMLCALAIVAAANIKAQAGTDVQMNSTTTNVQNEVSLTLNLNPKGGIVMGGNVNLVSAFNNQPGSTAGIGIGYSFDSGVSWSQTTIGTGIMVVDPVFGPTNLSNLFDPISGADTLGTVYAGYIAATNLSGDSSGLYVESSNDGGVTWSGPFAVQNNNAAAGMNAQGDAAFRFNDKPHLEVDNFSLNTMSMNTLYASWIQDVGGTPDKSDIRFASSIDGGMNWSVNPTVLNAIPGMDYANGPNVTVTPNGDVYVAWLDVNVTLPAAQTATLMFNKSMDGGTTFLGATSILPTITSLPNNFSTASALNTVNAGDEVRARGYPVIDADPNDGTGQTLYMTYAALGTKTNDEADIFFIRSTDGGTNWSSPLRVNDDLGITDQFAPWMDIKADGTIDIAWYDKRSDVDDDMWDVVIAKSTDGGLNFSLNTIITDAPFTAPTATNNEPWLGEYLGLVVDANTAYLGFTKRGDANGDVFFDSISNSAIPEPTSVCLALLSAAGLVAMKRRRRLVR